MIMFENAALFALSKDKDKTNHIFKINVTDNVLKDIRKNFSDCYDSFTKKTPIDFKTNIDLDKREAFRISDYSFQNCVTEAFSSDEIDSVTVSSFEEVNIKALIMGECVKKNNEDKYRAVLKRVTKNNVVGKGLLNIVFDGKNYTSLKNDVLVIPNDCLAVLSDDDSLLFSSFKLLNECIDVTNYYRLATELDLAVFKNNIKDDCLTNEIKNMFEQRRIRRLIALINDVQSLQASPQDIIKKANKQQISCIKFDSNGKLDFSNMNKKEIELALNFLADNTFIGTFSNKTNIATDRQTMS